MKLQYYFLFIILILPLSFANAQVKNGGKANFTNDRDGDGVSDISGQDKCPTTLAKIEGRLATVVNELTGKEVVIRLPKDLQSILYQDRVPLAEARKVFLNQRGEYRREKRSVEEKYGKYKSMKGKERKAKEAELDAKLQDTQAKIDSLTAAIKAVDPASYISFTGSSLTEDGLVVEDNIEVKIRIKVDSFGCLKDTDQDGVPDMVDLCDTEVGPLETNGCPDKDGDGIVDKNDDCPEEAGTRAAKGCPDIDGDGIADKNDACPTERGLKENKGCPDKDGDGIIDKDDECPEDKGLAKFQGCPDKDGDGIPDKDDDCPEEAGIEALKGCPKRDKDGDGVLDDEDECPEVPGPIENKGCPNILEKASRVLFETGKAVIKTQSYSLLDELVELLAEYPKSYIELTGHTDNQGSEANNLALSKDRAKAVKTYLIDKGIAEERISSTGLGEMRPIASNETTEGRTKNRRVEMKLSNKPKE